MKRIPILSFVLTLSLGLSFVWAAPVEEIDLTAVDDSAEASDGAPVVERTADGYINVDCSDATLASVIKQFRRTTRMNILNGDTTNLSRRVSVTLNHVPWSEALQSILGLADFKIENRFGMWFVSEKTKEEVQNATRYYVLKHASAVDLADLFNGISMKTSYAERNSIRSTTTTAKKENANGAGDSKTKELMSALAGRAKATAFPNTNTLVLTGPEANLNECERIITELDRPITQVYIEARFIELSTAALHKMGLDWSQLESWGASVKSLKAGYENNGGKAADYGMRLSDKTVNNNKTTTKTTSDTSSTSASSDGTSSANANNNGNVNENTTYTDNFTYKGIVPKEILEASGAGASAASMGWDSASTFSGQLSADDFKLAISAFENMQECKVFSNPRIIVANGKEAKVDMTTKDPNVEVTSSRSGTEGQNLDVSAKLETIPGTDRNLFAGEAFFSYGISLSVKPRVSSTGLISVEVVPTISEKTGEKVVNTGDSEANAYTRYPIIDVKTINTEFTMKDGATAVIGGLTQTSEEDMDTGIPYLRKIPWIGPKLFGWQGRQKVQKEILVFVTVGIANPETLQKDAGLPTNAVLGREYVEGRRLEPGQRPNAAKAIAEIDTRPLDEIRANPYDEDDWGKDTKKKEEVKAKKEELKLAKPEAKLAVVEKKETPKPLVVEKKEPPNPVVASEKKLVGADVPGRPQLEAPKPIEVTKVEFPKPVMVEKKVEAPKPVAKPVIAEPAADDFGAPAAPQAKSVTVEKKVETPKPAATPVAAAPAPVVVAPVVVKEEVSAPAVQETTAPRRVRRRRRD